MNRRHWLKTLPALSAGMLLSPEKIMAMIGPAGYTRADFGETFNWGVAGAAYQVEGAWNVDGKGLSIWDTFTHTPGKVRDNATGDVACDFYHRYESDIDLLKEMNVPNFRFSLSWSRIMPMGVGKVNQKGIDFYNRVIDKCLEVGVEPWVTLYHWDLPQVLEDMGGWKNRDIIQWFSNYVDICTKNFGDRVKKWMVLNEPMAFVGLGYFMGMHAPGKRGFGKFLAATHHAAMCQAEGGRIIRRNVPNADIGTTFSASMVYPLYQKERHVQAAARMDAMFNRLFLEPALGMGYPLDTLPGFKPIRKYMRPGDEEKLKFDFDYWGLQNYTREIVKYSIFPPILWAKQIKHEDKGVPLTEMKWEIYPEGIYELLKKFDAYEGINRIIVTENGASFPDKVVNGQIHDEKRLKFIQDYLGNVLKAKREGVNVDGYFIWTFLDNFEWAEGYHPRFGIVHVDFETQKRTLKDSGKWYRDFLASN